MSARILSIADHLQSGGAAGAAWYLNEGLSSLCYDVLGVVGKRDPLLTHYPVRVVNSSLPRRTLSGVPGLRRWFTRSAGDQFLRRLRFVIQEFRPELIHLHNIHGFASVHKTAERIFSVLPASVPMVWTLHDMWSFTGRCVYSFDCRKFIDGCDAQCPTPHEYVSLPPKEVGPAYWRKDSILRSRKMTAVCPSIWLANECRLSIWRNSRIEVIPYGIDTAVFAPTNRSEARRRFGLTTSGNVLLAMAANWNDRRKGGAILAAALEQAGDLELTLLVAGKGDMPRMRLPERVKIRPLGFLKSSEEKVAAYNAADVLINSSISDNLPLVILEAQACGLPAVVFDVGGMPEAVLSGTTGEVISTPTPEGLLLGIKKELEVKSPKRRDSIRQLTLSRYSLAAQAARYSSLFEEILHNEVPVALVSSH